MTKEEEIKRKLKRKIKNASSSIGRVEVSKTVRWGFEALLAWLNRPRMPNVSISNSEFETAVAA